MIYLPKSQPAPDCLAVRKLSASEDYRCGDVYVRLSIDFNNKCYLCEFLAPSSINIEHFVPHRGDRDLMFDWRNLFFACSHCNSTKHATEKFDDILNCTIVEDIDELLDLQMYPIPKETVTVKPLIDSVTVENTAELLNRIYNGTTECKTLEAANIRSALLKEIVKFNSLLLKYFDPELNDEEKGQLRLMIERSLRRSSGFCAFKRCIIRRNEKMLEEFGDFLTD